MRKVAQYDLSTGERIAVYPSLAAAAARFPAGSSGNVSRACRGLADSAYGYRWRFVRINRYGDYVVVLPGKEAGA